MRLIIPLIGLLFFGCKTLQFNTEYTIDSSDMTIVKNCGTSIYNSKITGKALDGLYKIVYNKGYSIAKFKNGIMRSKKGYINNKLWYRREQLKSGTSIFIEYYDKKIPSFWSTSKPYDSIHTYSNNYPTKVNIFYNGNTCEYTFGYDTLAGRLKIAVTGCKLEYIPSALESAVLNTRCNNNPLTYNTEDREFNKEITVEIINKQDTIYNHFELNENGYSPKLW